MNDQDEPARLLRRGVELLTRALTPVEGKDGKLYIALPVTTEAVTALAAASMKLAALAGAEHGITNHDQAVQWALQQVGLGAAREDPTALPSPTAIVTPSRSTTVRDAIAQLTFVASQLATGLDSELQVAMCHGQDREGEITSHLEIDTLTTIEGETRPTFSCVMIQGHPHREPAGTTLKPGVPRDLSEEDIDI